jgi:hypothetical protein
VAELEAVLTTYLLAHPGLSALIARRFFYDELPQGTALPAVVCIKISDNKIHTFDGQNALERPMIQFTALAYKKIEARAVANQLKAALCDYQGTMGGIEIQKIELDNEISSMQKIDQDKVYFEDLEFEINFIRRA